MLIALTGGARSGKSTAAVAAANSLDAAVTFIATAEAGDAEMTARIAQHRAERPAGWTTLEEPIDLVGAAERVDPSETIVIDCLAMWVANRMLTGGSDRSDEAPTGGAISANEGLVEVTRARVIVTEAQQLGDLLRKRSGTSIVVTNEVGSGVVPATPLGRAYRDVLGSVNQAIVGASDRAYLVVAGRLLELAESQSCV